MLQLITATVSDRLGVQYAGIYDGTQTYNGGDVVSFGSAAYLSLANGNVGQTPGSSSAWLAFGSGTSGSGGAAPPPLIFSSQSNGLFRLARVSGGLVGVPYSGGIAAQPLYLNDLDPARSGDVYQVLILNGGQIDWQKVTGHAGVASAALMDDNTLVTGSVTVTSGELDWN